MVAILRSDAVRAAGQAARRLLREVVLLGLAVVWTGFWLNVVRLHLRLGHPVDAGLTLLLTVGPAVGGVLWHLLDSVAEVEVPMALPGLPQQT